MGVWNSISWAAFIHTSLNQRGIYTFSLFAINKKKKKNAKTKVGQGVYRVKVEVFKYSFSLCLLLISWNLQSTWHFCTLHLFSLPQFVSHSSFQQIRETEKKLRRKYMSCLICFMHLDQFSIELLSQCSRSWQQCPGGQGIRPRNRRSSLNLSTSKLPLYTPWSWPKVHKCSFLSFLSQLQKIWPRWVFIF